MTISKLLIANRGEIARRIIRTCDRCGIATVAVYSDADVEAPFVREAGEAVALGGRTPAESYLNQQAVLGAARRTGADAIHPGYGFLSENAAFARACADAGLTFLGPSPEVIAAMGSKIAARNMMQAAGVPLAPAATLDAEAVRDLDSIAARIGLPLIVKASAGGGGKGMRIVRDEAQLADAIRLARDEAGAAFGDDSVFVERYVEGARHVEVQIIGDQFGTVRHLLERDCSIQRRHQKVIEEAPAPRLTDAARSRLTEVAVTAGRELGYVGVGTVEFLFDPAGEEVYFLEINTRLQVEHPVTEAITGLDLVAAQIQVAEGRSLEDILGPTVRAHGHAVEARLYAEDPADGFLPAAGCLERFGFPEVPGVRIDAGPEAGDEITPDYDPMIAKVIAHGTTREDACRLLARTLRRADIAGIRTNRDFLVRLLEDVPFRRGDVSTAYLDGDLTALTRPLLAPDRADVLLAAALATQARRRASALVHPTLPSGWRNVGSAMQERVFSTVSGDVPVAYDLPGGRFSVAGEALRGVVLRRADPDAVVLEVDGVRLAYSITRAGDRVLVSTAEGGTELREVPRFPTAADHQAPGSLAAPMPGRVVAVHGTEGDLVAVGEVLLVIEAMKMHHEICAGEAGRLVTLRVAEGDQVEAGAVIAVIDVEEERADG